MTSGRVVALIAEQRLRLSWSDLECEAETAVTIDIDDASTPHSAATIVRVQHAGWEAFANAEERTSAHRAGWRSHLDNLRSAVASAGPNGSPCAST